MQIIRKPHLHMREAHGQSATRPGQGAGQVFPQNCFESDSPAVSTYRYVCGEEADLRQHVLNAGVGVGVAHVKLEEGPAVVVFGVLATADDTYGRLRVSKSQAVLPDLPSEALTRASGVDLVLFGVRRAEGIKSADAAGANKNKTLSCLLPPSPVRGTDGRFSGCIDNVGRRYGDWC